MWLYCTVFWHASSVILGKTYGTAQMQCHLARVRPVLLVSIDPVLFGINTHEWKEFHAL